MIKVHQVTKRYQKTVLQNFSVNIPKGQITGFIGPNGAGKSTLMRIMLGLSTPDSGTITFDGISYKKLDCPMRTVGALLEKAKPHKELTVKAHLSWLAKVNDIAISRVSEVLQIVGMEKSLHDKVGTLSFGMNQRLGLAAALLGKPDFLILDEPVNGLDPQGVRWIRTFLREFVDTDGTVFMSSHLMTEMASTADHLVAINRGTLLTATSMSTFIETYSHGQLTLEDAYLTLLKDESEA